MCLQERDAAAAKIQVLVRSFLQTCRAKRQSKAAVVIQSAWRGYAARNRLRLKREAEIRARQHAAAAVIQVGTFKTPEKDMWVGMINNQVDLSTYYTICFSTVRAG